MPYKSKDKRRENQEINRGRIAAYNRAWAEKNKEKRRAYKQEYRKKNKEKIREYTRNYEQNFRERTDKSRETKRRWTARKLKFDLKFYLTCKIRHRIREAIKRGARSKKAGKTIQLLGCSFPELKIHIENQFTKGMSWGLVMTGRIHLDHRRPCASFNLVDPEQQKLCFHYTNLQPLWATDNLRKWAH